MSGKISRKHFVISLKVTHNHLWQKRTFCKKFMMTWNLAFLFEEMRLEKWWLQDPEHQLQRLNFDWNMWCLGDVMWTTCIHRYDEFYRSASIQQKNVKTERKVKFTTFWFYIIKINFKKKLSFFFYFVSQVDSFYHTNTR